MDQRFVSLIPRYVPNRARCCWQRVGNGKNCSIIVCQCNAPEMTTTQTNKQANKSPIFSYAKSVVSHAKPLCTVVLSYAIFPKKWLKWNVLVQLMTMTWTVLKLYRFEGFQTILGKLVVSMMCVEEYWNATQKNCVPSFASFSRTP